MLILPCLLGHPCLIFNKILRELKNELYIETDSFTITSKGDCDIIDITNKVHEIILENNFTEGNALVFVPGSTAGITTIEYESGLLKDYPKFFERIAPKNIEYHHNNTWHDRNGHSHIWASLQGASFMVPFKNKSLILGTWQQIIFVDFDNRPRNREIIVQLTGMKNKIL